MSSKFKAFGLALVAVVAFNAIAATGASAAEFHSEANATIITGDDDNTVYKFSTAGGLALECMDTTFTGTMTGTTTTTITLRQTTSGCGFLEEPATIDTTGCTYVVTSHTTPSGHLPTSLSCTGSSTVKITTSACTLSFGNQTGVGGVKITNLGSGSTADMTAHTTITTTFTKSGPLCFLISGNTGTLTGASTLKGFAEGAITGDLHANNYSVHEGAHVGISWG